MASKEKGRGINIVSKSSISLEVMRKTLCSLVLKYLTPRWA
jgi:hypothetical protein